MYAVVSELSAECRGYRCGAAICVRRRNAEVRNVCSSWCMGGGSVSHEGTGSCAGSGVLVPSVASNADRNDMKRSDVVWD
eukprot:2559093-Rhodomonas_salina.1